MTMHECLMEDIMIKTSKGGLYEVLISAVENEKGG